MNRVATATATATAVVIGLTAAGIYVSGPYRVMSSIHTAVQNSDTATLEAKINFPNLKGQFKTLITEQMAEEMRAQASNNPLAGVGMAIGLSMINGVVDTMVSPTGFAGMVRQQIGDREFNGENMEIKWVSYNQVVVCPKSTRECIFDLRPTSPFSWRLEGFTPEALDAIKKSS